LVFEELPYNLVYQNKFDFERNLLLTFFAPTLRASGRKRNSTTSLRLLQRTDITVDEVKKMPDKKARCNGFDVILQTNLFDKKENLAFVWNAAEFGTFLLNSVVMHMTQMQSSEVRYRKVKVLINQGIVWDS
jgi:hypothetical protein